MQLVRPRPKYNANYDEVGLERILASHVQKKSKVDNMNKSSLAEQNKMYNCN